MSSYHSINLVNLYNTLLLIYAVLRIYKLIVLYMKIVISLSSCIAHFCDIAFLNDFMKVSSKTACHENLSTSHELYDFHYV